MGEQALMLLSSDLWLSSCLGMVDCMVKSLWSVFGLWEGPVMTMCYPLVVLAIREL